MCSTGTIDSPFEAPASQPANTTPYPSITPSSDRVPKRDATPNDDLRPDAVIDGSIYLHCERLTIGEPAKTRDAILQHHAGQHLRVRWRTRI
jgi:hypothetical protein